MQVKAFYFHVGGQIKAMSCSPQKLPGQGIGVGLNDLFVYIWEPCKFIKAEPNKNGNCQKGIEVTSLKSYEEPEFTYSGCSNGISTEEQVTNVLQD